MATEIAFDTLGQALADGAEDLVSFNWLEVEHFQDVLPLDVDWPKLLMLERAGVYRVITARSKGKLVGYNGYFVQPPIRHKTSLWAVNDTLYVDPEHRTSTLGVRLLKDSEALLRALGVKAITQGNVWPDDHSTSGKARARFGALLCRMGYLPAENVYVKLL